MSAFIDDLKSRLTKEFPDRKYTIEDKERFLLSHVKGHEQFAPIRISYQTAEGLHIGMFDPGEESIEFAVNAINCRDHALKDAAEGRLC